MRRLPALVLALFAVILSAEVLLRLAAPVLPAPLEWYSGWADRKAEIIATSEIAPDLIILGDSSVMDGLDPHRLTSTGCFGEAFNAAIPAADIEIMTDWFGRVTDSAWSPDTVMVGLTSRTVTTQSATRYFDSIAVRDDLLSGVERTAGRFSAIIRHRATLRDPVRLISHYQSIRAGIDPERWNDLDSSGWAQQTTVGDYQSRLGENTGRQANLDRPDDALGEFLTSLQDDGIEVIVVWMPVTNDWISTRGQGRDSYETLTEAVRETVRNTGADFVDLSNQNDPALFNDPLHLNLVGAEIVSGQLAERLENGLACSSDS